jgi:ubiquinone/menaquinone biosynthesis C-methylase UbiE
MDHADHVRLLRDGIAEPGGIWADLGAGSGAFTLALAELIGPAGRIVAVDRDQRALQSLQRVMRAQFPQVAIDVMTADFARRLALPILDGVVMANSLHFLQDKRPVLRLVREYLRPGGRLVLVEYGTDRGNRWVPYPLAFPAWQALAQDMGYSETRKLHTRPSRFLGEIYAAVSLSP